MFLLGLVGFVLIPATLVQWRALEKNSVTHRGVPLKELLPATIEGGSIRDLPIADSEEMKRAVDEYLHYSEAIFRSYRRGDIEVSVYVAYWEPGRYHPRLITSHVPDNCWVGGGWTMDPAMEVRRIALGREFTLPAECRLFSRGSVKQYVAYWHIVGGTLSIYTHRKMGPLDMFFETFWDDITHGQREQYFVRISSNVPLASLTNDSLFQQILEALTAVGLTGRTDFAQTK